MAVCTFGLLEINNAATRALGFNPPSGTISLPNLCQPRPPKSGPQAAPGRRGNTPLAQPGPAASSRKTKHGSLLSELTFCTRRNKMGQRGNNSIVTLHWERHTSCVSPWKLVIPVTMTSTVWSILTGVNSESGAEWVDRALVHRWCPRPPTGAGLPAFSPSPYLGSRPKSRGTEAAAFQLWSRWPGVPARAPHSFLRFQRCCRSRRESKAGFSQLSFVYSLRVLRPHP